MFWKRFFLILEILRKFFFKDFDANKEAAIIQDYSALQHPFIEEDPHDYILLRELKQQEIMLSTRLNSILYQLHQARLIFEKNFYF